jgi:hypothetical protein
MTNKSHLTAIARKTASVPMRGLSGAGRITGRALDYGCGRGCDADTFGMERFDPHYSPDMPVGRFDTITCNYVLNVIESAEERLRVMRDIQDRLTDDGVAYITVRNDKAALNGTTSRGTWQGLIVLDLPIVQRGSGYVTYELTKSVHPVNLANAA